MALTVTSIALETITRIRLIMPAIERGDRELARQLRSAVNSVGLNLAESEGSDPGNCRARWHTAFGSARETRIALRLAQAWGYVPEDSVTEIDAQLDRVCAMLWRLTHGRARS